jgi:hypothetical protein
MMLLQTRQMLARLRVPVVKTTAVWYEAIEPGYYIHSRVTPAPGISYQRSKVAQNEYLQDFVQE